MAEQLTMTIRLPPQLSEKLTELARNTNRSAEELAGEAIASYVALNVRQIDEIKAALAEAGSGASGVPHDEVVKWVRSWGKENELPRPRPKA